MIRRSNYNITSSLSQENLQLLAPSQEQRVQDIEDDNQDDERSIAYDYRDEESDETHHHLHRPSPRLNINATTISSNNNVIFILSNRIVMNMWSTISGYMNSTRLIVLFVLCFQNSLFTVLRRYSQGVLKENYSKYELLLVAELIKILYSSWMISKNLKCASTSVSSSSSSSSPEEGGSTSTSSTIPIHKMSDPNKNNNNNNINKRRSKSLSKELFYLLSTSRKMLVLASIYGVMNILSFVALRNISAGMFTIISQCKILTTATFSTLILKRQYSWTKWRALITLLVGVLLFSESIWSENLSISTSTSTSSNNQVLGTIAVLIEVVLSGFASIYFEKVIKTDPLQLGIWERNFQLAVGSFPVYVLFIIGNGGGTAGFFGGWSILTFILSILGAAGGLLVALSIKYGDSILKTLATTGAIVVTGVLDHVFLGGPLTPSMMLTALQVIISICNYTFDATPTTPVSAATATTEESRSAKSTSTIMNNNVLLANDNNNNNSASSTTPTKMKVGRGDENDEQQQRQMNNSSSKNIEIESLLQRTRSPGLSETKNDTDNSILGP